MIVKLPGFIQWVARTMKFGHPPHGAPDEFGRFSSITQRSQPPADLTSAALAGLWWDAKGDWKRAHESAQQDEGPEGSWVHTYLRGFRASGQLLANSSRNYASCSSSSSVLGKEIPQMFRGSSSSIAQCSGLLGST